MKTKRYALSFLLMNCYYKVIDNVGATRINSYSKNINFNQQSHSLHNSMTYQHTSEPKVDFDRDAYRISNEQQNWNHNPVENSQNNFNSEYTNNEQDIQQPMLHNDKQKQYVGLSLIQHTTHNETNPQTNSLNSDFFPERIPMNIFTKEEQDCFNSGLVHFNQSCQELFKRGPCGSEEWLLLDLKSALQKTPRIMPKCERKTCRNDRIYWPITQRCYEQSEETDKELCLPGNTWSPDYFSGHGICKCLRTPTIHGLFNDGTCYPLYTQGPCLKNHIFVEKDYKTECVQNPCKNSSLVIFEDGDNKCYQLNSKGPCDEDQHFIISSITLKPTCSKILHPLIINPPSLCSVTNANNVCPQEIKIEQGGDYIKNILKAALKKKSRSQGN